MAKTNSGSYEKQVKKNVTRKGVHAKSKMSSLKSSKNYTKKNKGQG